jgi:hypothetical protein
VLKVEIAILSRFKFFHSPRRRNALLASRCKLIAFVARVLFSSAVHNFLIDAIFQRCLYRGRCLLLITCSSLAFLRIKSVLTTLISGKTEAILPKYSLGLTMHNRILTKNNKKTSVLV